MVYTCIHPQYTPIHPQYTSAPWVTIYIRPQYTGAGLQETTKSIRWHCSKWTEADYRWWWLTSLTKQHRAKVDVWLIEQNVWLSDMSDQHEWNSNVISTNQQIPVGLNQRLTWWFERERHLSCHIQRSVTISETLFCNVISYSSKHFYNFRMYLSTEQTPSFLSVINAWLVVFQLLNTLNNFNIKWSLFI